MSLRFWTGTALLAGSWLLGLDYFYPADPWAALALVVAAVVLLGRTAEPLAVSQRPLAASQRIDFLALLLFLPAV